MYVTSKWIRRNDLVNSSLKSDKLLSKGRRIWMSSFKCRCGCHCLGVYVRILAISQRCMGQKVNIKRKTYFRYRDIIESES